MQLGKFKGYIWDLDGTLADTMGDLGTSMNEMLRANGFPERTDQQLLEAINYGSTEFVRLSLPEQYRSDAAFVKEKHAQYTRCYDIHFKDTTALYPGVGEVVAKMKAAGYKLGMFSNKQHSHAAALIDKLFPHGTFDAVLGQTELPHKPDPTGAFLVAGKMGCKPEEIAFIGDSHIDIRTAKNAGMYPVGVSWGYRSVDVLLSEGAKFVAESAEDLLALLTL